MDPDMKDKMLIGAATVGIVTIAGVIATATTKGIKYLINKNKVKDVKKPSGPVFAETEKVVVEKYRGQRVPGVALYNDGSFDENGYPIHPEDFVSDEDREDNNESENN